MGEIAIPLSDADPGAFDADSGDELWSYKLPFIGSAPPTSYEINNEQYKRNFINI